MNFTSTKRLLIPITYQFSIRYLLRTGLLQRISEYAQPLIALTWQDAELSRELKQLGAEVYLLPETHLGPTYTRIRRQVDTWHLRKRLKSVSTDIDARRTNVHHDPNMRLLQHARTLKHLLRLMLPGEVERMLAVEERQLKQDTNLAEFEQMISQMKPDAVFSFTPYHRQEELVLRAAKVLGIPMVTSIISFDNITTRGWIPIIFDTYMVWNHYNEQELYRAYPEASSSHVVIVGPAQFDFYWDKRYLWSEREWQNTLSLSGDRPVILYGASTVNIAPHEPLFLYQLDEAISNNEIPDKPIIILRRHPMDGPERWQEVLGNAQNIVYDDPWALGQTYKYTNIRHDDVAKLVSTLAYSQVHINVSSTMTLDGAVFDRPQIGPAYDDRPGRKYARIMKELYEREHYLPITYSGGLDVVYSRNEMIDAVKTALLYPSLKAVERKQMLKKMCTFLDGKCTDRVAETLRQALM